MVVRFGVVERRGAMAALFLVGSLGAGCGGASDSDSGGTETGTDEAGASDSAADETTGTDGGTTGDTGDTTGETSGEDDTESTDDGPIDPPPSAACDDVELPPGNGVEIVVSPGPDGTVMVDGAATTLRAAVNSASPGDTVLLEDGTYVLPAAGPGDYTGVYFTQPDVTLRSASGDASAVIIDGAYASQGDGTAPITIDAPGVVVADLTVQRSIFHLIHIWADGDDALIHNVDLVDGGQQFLKASVNGGTVDGVEVSCSRFAMTAAGRDNVWGYGDQDGSTRCYTGGIDTHNARDWVVHDSWFEGIYCDATGVPRPAHGQFPELRDGMTYQGGLAEHGIHMWDSAQGSGHTLVRNRVVNCARGIGVGLVDTVYGSTVVNNMVFSEHEGSSEHDVGIIVERAVDTVVAHNTVFFSHPNAYSNAIEYRWEETSNLTMHGNLTSHAIMPRNGATANESDNVTSAGADWFVDPSTADLHLTDCEGPGQAALHAAVPEDFDGDPRSDPTVPGADECAP